MDELGEIKSNKNVEKEILDKFRWKMGNFEGNWRKKNLTFWLRENNYSSDEKKIEKQQ